MSYQLLVCGSREYELATELERVLDALVSVNRPSQVIVGGARGADRLAAAWSRKRGFETVTVLADWNRDGKSAGFKRNERMVNRLRSGDKVVAFVVDATAPTAGTAHTMGLAAKKGFPVRVYDHASALSYAEQAEAFKAIEAQI